MKIYTLNKYGKTYKIALMKGKYSSNDTLAIEMVVVNSKGKVVEPWSMLTVNINDSDVLASDTMAFIDTNNNGDDIGQWLVENEIAQKTWFTGMSGWCTYPLFAFNEEALNEMEAIG